MTSTLLTSLLGFYEEDPNDPFNVYALALEYQKFDLDKARFYFDLLLRESPDYLATYYSAGQFFVSTEEFEKAMFIYVAGIELAKEKGNHKTVAELQRAMRSLEDEMEE